MAFLTDTNRVIYLTKQQNICAGKQSTRNSETFQRLDY